MEVTYETLKKLADDTIKAYWEKKDEALFEAWKEATDHLNPCTKPHNNGEDTCNECQVIKKGV